MARFLLVDDDEGMVDSMRCFLKAKAHEVFIAHDGHDAQILMQETTFDILILDWDLPDTTGTELCKFYRSTGGVGQVVMLTGRTSKKDTVEGLSAGADDYLTKPISIPEFDARVEAQLRRAAMSNRQPLVFDESMVGKTFAGSYKIDALLGQGAMGIVFKARHTTIDRIAAIKILASNSCWSNDRKRFEREAKAMSLLNHPRIIRIYDYGIAEQNTPFIVMEFLEGMPLNKVLETYGSLPVKDAIALIIQVCEGLEHAHANSMLHRDLKPANIMISEDGNNATILDMGIVKFLDDQNAAMKLTLTGEVFGSPLYMSPEQSTNQALDPRSDVYSLACVLYETITGQVPFAGNSFIEVTNAKMAGKAPSICEKFPHAQFHPALDSAIKKALSISPEKRHGTITQFKTELQEVQALLLKEGDRPSSRKNSLIDIVKGAFGKKN